MLRDIADIIVCAPESARSGFATAFSATVPLRLKLRRDEEGMQMWSCNGTPVDCVKLALQELCVDRLPDMILGGINHGDNASVNVHYSGTMGVTIEGCMKYIPSIGFSRLRVGCRLRAAAPVRAPDCAEGARRGSAQGRVPERELPEAKGVQGREDVSHGYGHMVQRVCEDAPPTRLRLLLDDGRLPQRRAGAGGYRQLGAHTRICLNHADAHRRYRLRLAAKLEGRILSPSQPSPSGRA